MDLELTNEQAQLRDELRRYLRDRLPNGELLARLECPGAVDRQLWRGLGKMGVFSVILPESAGGLGLGRAEAVIVFEELGRAAVPGPLVQTFLAASLIAGAATGEQVIGAVLDEQPLIVEHLDALDGLLVFDADGAGVRLVDRPSGTAYARPLDPLTPVHRVDSLAVGTQLGDRVPTASLRRDADLLIAALQVGLAEGAVVMATEYSKSRTQFGRAIGSFQAIKHLLVDAHVWVDVARAAVHAAAVEIDERAALTTGSAYDGHTCSVASARIVASSAAARATETSIQVHGGMGYTWELAAQLYFKRVAALDATLGSPDASLALRAKELMLEATVI